MQLYCKFLVKHMLKACYKTHKHETNIFKQAYTHRVIHDCLHTHAQALAHTHTHRFTHICTHTHTHTWNNHSCRHTHTETYMTVNTHTYVLTHTHTHTHTLTDSHTYALTVTHTCTHTHTHPVPTHSCTASDDKVGSFPRLNTLKPVVINIIHGCIHHWTPQKVLSQTEWEDTIPWLLKSKLGQMERQICQAYPHTA